MGRRAVDAPWSGTVDPQAARGRVEPRDVPGAFRPPAAAVGSARRPDAGPAPSPHPGSGADPLTDRGAARTPADPTRTRSEAAPRTHRGTARTPADPLHPGVPRPPEPGRPPHPADSVPPAEPLPTHDETDRDAEPADSLQERTRRIDESLIRLTAAHEGLPLAPRDGTDGDEPDEPDDAAAPERLGPLPTPRLRVLRAAAVVLAVLVFAASTVGWSSQLWLEGRIHPVTALDPASGAILDADAQSGARNVLVLGLDPATGGAFVPGAGSGTVVVAHVPPAGGPVTRIAFPRDLEINRPPCQRWDPAAAAYLDQTVPAETRTKLDTAFQVGGPSCAVRVVQQLTGLSITGFAAVDVTGLAGMADALGGVTTCLDRPVVDGVLGQVTTAAGPVTVRGAEVTGIVRARHVQGDAATDEGLVERQHRVLAAVLDRALSTPVLLDPWEVRAFGRVFGQGTVADGVDPGQLLAVASAVAGLGAGAGPFVTVPTTGANTRGNVELRDRDAAAMFKALRTGAPIPPSAVAEPAASSSPAPGSITVDVLNAADRDGLAAQVGDALRAAGFGVGQVANAPEPAADTVIRFSPDRSAQAQVVAAAVPSARAVPDATASGVLQLLLGNSFDGTVRAVAATSPTAPPAGPTAAADCG